MGNIGVGETYVAWLVKKENMSVVDTLIKDTGTEMFRTIEYGKRFKYRYLSEREITYQPLPSYLKEKMDKTIYTSELGLYPNERDVVYLENGRHFRVVNLFPQKQHGMFLISKKTPFILELE